MNVKIVSLNIFLIHPFNCLILVKIYCNRSAFTIRIRNNSSNHVNHIIHLFIVPAAEEAGISRWWLVLAGVIAGMLFLNVLDLLTPHLHRLTGLDEEEHRNNASLNRVLLFVLAIALHKFPEGMAAGVGFNAADSSSAWAVSFGIALQNVPEGMVVIAPLLIAGVSKLRTFLISLAIALLEVVGVWVGYGMGSISSLMLPVMLALAGGAMLYVVSDEMIPETHSHGYQKVATYALVLGFVTLVFLDLAF